MAFNRFAYVLMIIIFSILTFKELFVHSEADINVKEIPFTKMGMNIYSGPTLKFQYCFSCGYHKAFQEYGNIIQQKYPEISIEGENYQPHSHNMMLSKVLGAAKMVLIVCILASVNVFLYIGQPQPSWWTWCIDNKLYSCFVIFFISNSLENYLISTGAFEIAFNDVPVWSKLETGRIPQPSELFQIIDNNLQFQNKVELKPGFAK